MKKRIAFFLLAVALPIFTFMAATAASSVPDAVIRAADSVVRIRAEYTNDTGYATGTGFVIGSDDQGTLVVTNHHVIEGDLLRIDVYVNETSPVAAEIAADSTQMDLCVLRIPKTTDIPSAVLAAEDVQRGDAVYAVGFPAAADALSDTALYNSSAATITDGIVSAERQYSLESYAAPVRLLQINVDINAGNSGGPLFNADGEVVGINTLGVLDSSGINGAIHAAELQKLLMMHGLQPTGPTQPHLYLYIGGAVLGLAAVLAAVFLLRRRKMRKKPAAMLHPAVYDTAAPTESDLAAGESPFGAADAAPVPTEVRAISAEPPAAQKTPETTPMKQAAVPAETAASSAGQPILPKKTSNAADPSVAQVTRPAKRAAFPVFVCCTAAALLLFLGAYIFGCSRAGTLVTEGRYREAKRSLLLPAVTVLHDPQLVQYVQAGEQMLLYRYEQAATAFASLGNYRSAAALALEAQSLYAAQLADTDRFEEALAICEALAEQKYPHSMELSLDIRYRYAAYLLYEENEYSRASVLFSALARQNYRDSAVMEEETAYLWALALAEEEKYVEAYQKLAFIPTYADVADLQQALADTIHQLGAEDYCAGDYSGARRQFECIRPYGYSDGYLTLCAVHLRPHLNVPQKAASLLESFYLEDASRLLVSTPAFAAQFVNGRWWSADGSKWFEMDAASAQAQYRLPDGGYRTDRYDIRDGIYYLQMSDGSELAAFWLNPLSPDSMEIYCYLTNESVIVYRS